ncbi:LysR family transcriptional regulator [Massilia sp. 9096]|uniref:LysR family transcriptional regulator n=1 Tax=Massilia sp. 9096 TaxID=1500894 RepID=UPI000565A025|nr:LysR family transcriptional regulator [Massilia sp. 9096]
MPDMDLNLLLALDALLAHGSITRAAGILGLSPSAMSRTLTRLRDATGDPLLVRAGRDMVLTPHAETLRTRTRAAVLEAQALLAPAPHALDLAALRRTFRIRANEAFVEAFGATLIAAVAAQAPLMRLHFSGKPDRKPAYLRDGDADLEVGVVENMGPEVRVRALFRDRYVGVVRAGHPLATGGAVTAARYAAFSHVATPHGERIVQALDASLVEQGLRRSVAAVVPVFSAALAVALASDLVALLPASFMLAQHRPAAAPAAAHPHAFELPVPLDGFSISLMWHPRAEADPAHRWLRELIVAACRERMPL